MIRILIVDDEDSPTFIEDITREVRNILEEPIVESQQINPAIALDAEGENISLPRFLEQITEIGSEFWDVAIIDVNLADIKQLSDDAKIQLPISVAEAFRKSNHSATVILYTGSLADHVDKLLKGDLPAEAALKRIFKAEIANFVPRRRIGAEVLSALDNPSWLLRVERMLMRHAKMMVGPKEAEFKNRSFEDLAKAVRQQDPDGQRIAQLAVEHGISCLVDLNS